MSTEFKNTKIRKTIKRLVKITLWILGSFLTFFLGLAFSLQFKPIQSWASQQAAQFLSHELNAQIEINSLYVKPFSSLTMEGLFISDQMGDTLLYTEFLETKFDLTKILQRKISIQHAKLQNASFRLQTSTHGQSNLQFLLDYFKQETNSKSSKIILNIKKLNLDNLTFSYINKKNKPKKNSNHVDFDHILATNIHAEFQEMGFHNETFTGRILELQLQEKSGFLIRNLKSQISIGTQHIYLSDLSLETNQSLIQKNIKMDFESYSNFQKFMSEVYLEWEAKDATIHSEDIEYFASELSKVHFKTTLTGHMKGTVSNFEADVANLQIGKSTLITGKAHIAGLPDIKTTWFDTQISSLKTNPYDIEHITKSFSNQSNFKLPNQLLTLEKTDYQGTWIGYYHNFDIHGVLRSELGTIQTDVKIQIEDDLKYSGQLTMDEFNLGKFLNRSDLQNASLEIQVDGIGLSSKKLASHFSVDIPSIEFKNYRYKNLEIEADIFNELLKTQIISKDPALQFQLDGELIFQQNTPYKLKATTKLEYLDPLRLKWLQDRNLFLTASTLETDLNFTNYEDLAGRISLQNTSIHIDHQLYSIKSFDIIAHENSNRQKNIQLNSDLIDAKIKGQVDWKYVPKFIENLFTEQNSQENSKIFEEGKQNFTLEVNFKQTEPVWKFFGQKISIQEGGFLKGIFSNETETPSQLNGFFPEIQYEDHYSQDINLLATKTDKQGIKIQFKTQKTQAFNTLKFHQLEITQQLQNQKINFEIKLLADSTADNYVHLIGQADLLQNRKAATIKLDPSTVLINTKPWRINNNLNLQWSKDQITIENFELSHQNQKLTANGQISKIPGQKINLDFHQLDIGMINPFLVDENIEVKGILQGKSQIHSVLGAPYALANLTISELSLNQSPLGKLDLSADFDPLKNLIKIDLGLEKNQIQTLNLNGTFNYLEKENQLDLLAKLNDLEVHFLESILSELVSNVEGKITGQTSITGNWKQPKFTGTGNAKDILFTTNYLGTSHRFSGPFKIKNTQLIFDNLQILDPKNNRAILNGSIDLNHIRAPFIDVNFNTQNFLVLSTTLKDNKLYNGTAYGTGTFSFIGRPNDMQIDIQAKTEENTVFNIPLHYTSNLSDHEFIRFVSKENQQQKVVKESTKGLTLNLDLYVSPEAEARITTDLGELKGRGEGQLTLRISTLGDFEMFGDYQINTGKFNFSAQDFINKNFEIRPGGHIRWTGRPTEATMNLTAFYEQRTNLSALYSAAGRPTNEQRVLAQAEMLLNGNLLRPQIQFGLNFPNDPYVKDELQGYLSDANNINQQTLSLIVRRSFITNSTTAQDFSREVNSTLLGAGTEIAFNQLNNILTESLNLNFMDLQIRSLNDASASLRLFKDRLILSGGISDRRTEQLNDLNVFSNQIATDAELRYLIRSDGRLILRASNKLNTRHFLLNPTDEYISAIGLIYRQEFNAFEEFFNTMLLRKIRKK